MNERISMLDSLMSSMLLQYMGGMEGEGSSPPIILGKFKCCPL